MKQEKPGRIVGIIDVGLWLRLKTGKPGLIDINGKSRSRPFRSARTRRRISPAGVLVAGGHRNREATIGMNRSRPVTLVVAVPSPAGHIFAQAAQRVVPLIVAGGIRSVVRGIDSRDQALEALSERLVSV
jgi:hypothetical protein